HRTGLEKQVHQHGLAAADLAVNVEAARRRLILVRKQPAEQALLAHRLVAGKPPFEIGEGVGDFRLRRVGLDRAGRDQGLILAAEGIGGGRQHGPPYGPSRPKIASREFVRWVCGNLCGRYASPEADPDTGVFPAKADRVCRGLSALALEYRITRSRPG